MEGEHKHHRHHHDAKADAQALRAAMKGLGTKDSVLIDIIGSRPRKYLTRLIDVYKEEIGRDLLSDVKSETSGDYRRLLLALLRDTAHFNAKVVHKAVKGLGTDELSLSLVLSTSSNKQLKAMQTTYKELFKKDMDADVVGDTSGDYRRLLVSLLKADRDESSNVDVAAAKADALLLYKKGEGRLGTDTQVFTDIFSKRSRAQLYAICRCYEEANGHTLQTAIQKELLITPFAEIIGTQLNKAMKGLGTSERVIISSLVRLSRSQRGIVDQWYTQKYGKTLANDLSSDLSGDFLKLCLKLLPEHTAGLGQ